MAPSHALTVAILEEALIDAMPDAKVKIRVIAPVGVMWLEPTDFSIANGNFVIEVNQMPPEPN